MAQFNTGNNSFQLQNKTLFEVNQIATANGSLVTNTNPLPVSLGSETITITGNVNVSTVVQVNSTPENPVHNHITEVGTGGLLTTPYLPIGGNVFVTGGTINVSNQLTSVNIGNFPATYPVTDNGGSLTVDGTVNIGTMPEVEIKNDTGNRIPVSLEAGSYDAFGRIRVSEAYTLGDYKHLYGIDPNFVDVLVNGGSITYRHDQACARLATTSNTTSSAIHQTKFYHHYMPGKSQLIKSTFNFYSAVANVTKRSGYFDDKNGIYFEQAGNGVLSFCVRTYTSGSASDARKVIQSQWNIDKCDGTGPSGFNIDITKTQILFIDFQWLGVGRVRTGFVHDGQYIIAHEFYNSNVLDVVYISNPNLPVRCEILNNGATTGGFMDQICSTVISEGGYVEAGQDWAASSPSLRTIAAGATLPVLALRLSNTFKTYENRMIARSGLINVLTTAENIKWKLIKLPDSSQLTGNTWVNVNTDSGVQYNATATAYTDGQEIDNGYVSASTQGGKSVAGAGNPNDPSSAKKNYIVQNFDSSNSEIYVVAVTNLGAASTTVGVGWQWREIY